LALKEEAQRQNTADFSETKQAIKRKIRKCNKINGAIKRHLGEQMSTQNKTTST
jgi:hypothetical protein